ncbi:hypothetical protein OG897_32480 [Streptomyces sp. NBC_00237]|uniref:hypothetical protein n=1 Tax=Streptomyces sp. NBC_00237 TaxID=2975687 RepID=UPI002257F2D9|nr:hypothetical protein [Streptomyces sp. NBC_00237]MCX5206114.1 hypothetical protein [Streptomyces sp. NBC_00237]
MRMSVGLDAKELKAGTEGVMPWLSATGLAAEALALLHRPLMCWTQHEYGLFDSAGHYADYPGLSRRPISGSYLRIPTSFCSHPGCSSQREKLCQSW